MMSTLVKTKNCKLFLLSIRVLHQLCTFRCSTGIGFYLEDLNAEVDAGGVKKKQKENDVNLDDAFMRFEFLELVMRLAMKFPQTADPKVAFKAG